MGFLPFLWRKSGDFLENFGYGEEYEVGLRKSDKEAFEGGYSRFVSSCFHSQDEIAVRGKRK